MIFSFTQKRLKRNWNFKAIQRQERFERLKVQRVRTKLCGMHSTTAPGIGRRIQRHPFTRAGEPLFCNYVQFKLKMLCYNRPDKDFFLNQVQLSTFHHQVSAEFPFRHQES